MFDDDCIYCLETPTTDPGMPKRHCQLLAGDEDRECIGILNCVHYRSVGGREVVHNNKNSLSSISIRLPKCKHRALYRPEYCGGPCATDEGFKCVGETRCLHYEEGDEKKEMSNNFDVIHKPSHYTEGRKYEPKDVIRDWDLNFNLGNTVKYVARAGRKDDILQDLKKARQYLDFEIEYLEKERKEK